MNEGRLSWKEYFMLIAIVTAMRTSCFSEGKGAVIVKDNRIIATGYNGAPHNICNCKYDLGYCVKRRAGYKHGEGQEVCNAVHAEMNAIMQAARTGISIKDAVLYCTHEPCAYCARHIIQAGISEVVYKKEYCGDSAAILLMSAGVKVNKLQSVSLINVEEQEKPRYCMYCGKKLTNENAEEYCGMCADCFYKFVQEPTYK